MPSGLVSSLVADAFAIVAGVDSDLVVSATLYSLSADLADNYDPETGFVSRDEGSTSITNAIFSKRRERQTDSLTVVSDMAMLIFSADQITGAAPVINDTVVIDGVTYNIQDVEFPPGESLYKLRIRKA